MAGFSVSMSKNGRRLLFGAPGAFYWQGQVYSKWSDEGGLLHKTREGPASQDDSYLGYSSAVGEFDGDGEEDNTLNKIADGINMYFTFYFKIRPNIINCLFDKLISSFLLGKNDIFFFIHINILLSLLVIHTQNVCLSQIGVIIMFIEIFQLGAYFGYSVAVQDLDGKQFHVTTIKYVKCEFTTQATNFYSLFIFFRLDDIIVGAPLYSDYSSKHTYDAGRVYIYYQNNK
ncbi:LOW QUALITY PROTEIN: hypothetical protein KUTeg_008104, partial [Tegillarca granosa]